MDLFSIDDKNPLLPTSATEFAGQFDPVVAMNSGLDYVANELGLYKWEPLLVPYVQEYMPSYFQGWSRPEEFVHSLIFFDLFCVLLAASWILVYLLCNVLLSSFNSIYPAHKKWYVVANWSKAFWLCLHTFSSSWWYYSFLHYRCELRSVGVDLGDCNFAAVPQQGQWTKLVSAVYVSTDVVALIMVNKLPTTTVVHHWVSALLVLYCFYVDLSLSPVAQKMCMYGFFSTLAYSVNFFLAMRVCTPKASWLKSLGALSAVIYAVVCALNWGFHALWLIHMVKDGTLTYGPIIWLAFMLLLVRDDLVLMKWLWTYNPNAPENLAKGDGKAKEKKDQ